MKKVIVRLENCLYDSDRLFLRGWQNAFMQAGFCIPECMLESFLNKDTLTIHQEIDKLTQDHDITLHICEMQEQYVLTMMLKDKVQLRCYALDFIKYCEGHHIQMTLLSTMSKASVIKLLTHHQWNMEVCADDLMNCSANDALLIDSYVNMHNSNKMKYHAIFYVANQKGKATKSKDGYVITNFKSAICILKKMIHDERCTSYKQIEKT